jgi:hypothetical protein
MIFSLFDTPFTKNPKEYRIGGKEEAMPDFEKLYSLNANNMKKSVIRELLKLLD